MNKVREMKTFLGKKLLSTAAAVCDNNLSPSAAQLHLQVRMVWWDDDVGSRSRAATKAEDHCQYIVIAGQNDMTRMT